MPIVKSEIEKPAVPENIHAMSTFSDTALMELGVPETKRHELLAALDEAITNVVLHGYVGKEGTLRIAIGRDGDRVLVELTDTGTEFDPTTMPEPDFDVPIEQREIGGMGVPMMRKFTDGLEYFHKDGANHLILMKKIGDKNG